MEKTYAQALFTLSQKPGASVDDLVKTLVAHLQETGRAKLLPRILRELKRLDARATNLSDTFEVANESEKTAALKEAAALGITASATVNEALISGWRAQKGSRIIDRSGKRALLDLYNRITVQH